jgi:hypothetical protein
MEKMSWEGIWWNPTVNDVVIDQTTDFSSIPDGTTGGSLSYSPTSGTRLELIGTLDADGADEVPIMHGMTTNGNTITLTNCVWKNKQEQSGSGHFATEIWVGSNVFLHTHSDSGCFDSLSISFPSLTHWFGKGNLDQDEDADEYDPRMEQKEVDCTDFDLQLVFSEFPSPHGSSTYPDEASLHLDLSSNMDFNEISRELIRPLQNYYSLAMAEQVFPKSIEAGHGFRSVEVYYRDSHYTDTQEVFPTSMSFTLNDVDFEESMLQWFDHNNKARTFHNLYFSAIYSDNMYTELEFLSLVIALETYHRHFFPNDYHMENDPYAAFRDAANERLPNVRAKERTLNLINSIGNDYSLRSRLESVTSDYRSILDPLIDVDDTLRDSTNFRHEIAHGLGSGYDAGEMAEISSRLRAVCETLLLDAVGLDDPLIRENLIERYRRHNHFPKLTPP